MNKRVLIVEDDTVSAQTLKRLLGFRDIYCECVGSFKSGLALVSQGHFDAVVCDLDLPDSEPTMTIERMSELHPTSAIAFTGVDDPAIIRECLKRGIRFILKGTSSSGIVREILLIMEWNEPSLELEKALIAEAKAGRSRFIPWYQRLAPVATVVLSLVTASFVGGAALFNIISDRATQSTQTSEHFIKLDEAIVLQKTESVEIRRNQMELQMKAQTSTDERAALRANQELLRSDVIRRLERIEDKLTGSR